MEHCLHCLVKCPKCAATFLRQQWKKHFQESHESEEQKTEVRCSNTPCEWSGSADEARPHALVCPFYLIKCLMCPPNDHGDPAFVPKTEYKAHLTTHEPRSVVEDLLSCVNANCSVQKTRFELLSHMTSCMYECDFCQYPVRRQELHDHLQTTHTDQLVSPDLSEKFAKIFTVPVPSS
eukprot:TRINITY_DN7162_c0_g1_i1.p1 TRINITY_DN7162_c0_g1~~TRINITY_DN7162_c0_g1_i1.p1  ORF type:complete len:178 (-),score=17.36 TRINITY_DN7162_c0_g1_i1:245-778(-)